MEKAFRMCKVVMPVLIAMVLAVSLFGAPASAVRAATLCVEPTGADGCYTTIQAAITAASTSTIDTIQIRAGTYKENIIINKPVILSGVTRAEVILMPALNGPTCTEPETGSICTGSSSVIIVQASNVHIQHLTIDGDNPDLTGGVAQGGADVNARNGIIQNDKVGVFNNMVVNDVLVKNMYLSGIYNSSSGLDFNIHDNVVQNVQGAADASAIWNYNGRGEFRNNTVSQSNNGIASYYSRGTRYISNTITNSEVGVYSYNAGNAPGSTADLLQANHISSCKPSGYGLQIFAPYVAPTVDSNIVETCAVGLAQFGSRNTTPTSFTKNQVDGAGTTGGAGVQISTSLSLQGSENVVTSLTNNIITNFNPAVTVDAELAKTAAVSLENNAIEGGVNGVLTSGAGVVTVNAQRNWWGAASGPTVAANPGGTGVVISSGVIFSPWLCAGTDTSTDPGFQPGTALCAVASKLVFSTQPGGAEMNALLNPQPVVHAVDANGILATNFNGPVTLSFGTNPNGGTLAGTKTVNAINGVATFSGLSINLFGKGYTLKASSGSLADGVSAPFDIPGLNTFLPIVTR